MTNESPAGGMTDTAQTGYVAGPQERKFCEVVLATYGTAEAIHPVISQFLLAREEIISTSRTEALRRSAAIVRELSSTLKGQPMTPHPYEHMARACSDAALQTAAELVESLITTDQPDSGVNLDATPR